MSLVLLLFLGLSHFVVGADDPAFAYSPGKAQYHGENFTGIAFKRHPSGSLYRLQFFKAGMQFLTEHRWFPDGTKWAELEYADGQLHGEHRTWYADGKVRFLKHYERGLPHGEFWGWHQNGTVSDYYVYEKGRELVYKSFISDGKPFYNYVVKDGDAVGVQGGSFCKTQTKRLSAWSK